MHLIKVVINTNADVSSHEVVGTVLQLL